MTIQQPEKDRGQASDVPESEQDVEDNRLLDKIRAMAIAGADSSHLTPFVRDYRARQMRRMFCGLARRLRFWTGH